MTRDAIVRQLNEWSPPVWRSMRAVVVDVFGPNLGDEETGARMSYTIGKNLCHTDIIVQGGVVGAMLDSTMTCALFGHFLAFDPPRRVQPASLELKTNFLRVANNGPFDSRSRVRRLGRTVAFQEGELYQNDVLVATASMTSQLLFPEE
ncbi:MAG: PaaI family thioesterase [Pseudomonadota bacterium]